MPRRCLIKWNGQKIFSWKKYVSYCIHSHTNIFLASKLSHWSTNCASAASPWSNTTATANWSTVYCCQYTRTWACSISTHCTVHSKGRSRNVPQRFTGMFQQFDLLAGMRTVISAHRFLSTHVARTTEFAIQWFSRLRWIFYLFRVQPFHVNVFSHRQKKLWWPEGVESAQS